MLRRLLLCSSFVVVSGLMACDDESIVAPSSLACYTLTLGAWNAPLPETLPPPPLALQLTDSLGTQILENGRRVVRSLPAGSAKAYPFQFWEAREGGDVLIVFSNGFTGMTMDLVPAAGNYSGTARAFFDFGTFDLSAPVQLTRNTCG